jgi:hypothetical protein
MSAKGWEVSGEAMMVENHGKIGLKKDVILSGSLFIQAIRI